MTDRRSPTEPFDPDGDPSTTVQHWLALNALDRIEFALFGDNDGRDVDALEMHAEHLRKMGEFESALWTIPWQTGRSVTLSIGGGHDIVYHVSVGGWSKEDSPIAFYNNDDLATLETRVIAYADRLNERTANAPLPDPEDDQ